MVRQSRVAYLHHLPTAGATLAGKVIHDYALMPSPRGFTIKQLSMIQYGRKLTLYHFLYPMPFWFIGSLLGGEEHGLKDLVSSHVLREMGARTEILSGLTFAMGVMFFSISVTSNASRCARASRKLHEECVGVSYDGRACF